MEILLHDHRSSSAKKSSSELSSDELDSEIVGDGDRKRLLRCIFSKIE